MTCFWLTTQNTAQFRGNNSRLTYKVYHILPVGCDVSAFHATCGITHLLTCDTNMRDILLLSRYAVSDISGNKLAFPDIFVPCLVTVCTPDQRCVFMEAEPPGLLIGAMI